VLLRAFIHRSWFAWFAFIKQHTRRSRTTQRAEDMFRTQRLPSLSQLTTRMCPRLNISRRETTSRNGPKKRAHKADAACQTAGLRPFAATPCNELNLPRHTEGLYRTNMRAMPRATMFAG